MHLADARLNDVGIDGNFTLWDGNADREPPRATLERHNAQSVEL